ncbi:MAG: peroxiredoxin [Gammaproteobacteria bacterium]|nr:peroxiredoxin [Gammaproteobacteria bacterium]
MLTINQAAPSFTTTDQNHNSVSLSDFSENKNVILYFYPKDDTSGCTIEANQFTAMKDQFDQLDCVILGVSKDDAESHCAFIDKFDLKLTLLADTSGTLCNDYGVWQDKGKDGITKMGIVRSTFVINKKGLLIYAQYAVTADGHAQEILNVIKSSL